MNHADAMQFLTETSQMMGREYARENLTIARWSGDDGVTVHGITIRCRIAYDRDDKPANDYTFTDDAGRTIDTDRTRATRAGVTLRTMPAFPAGPGTGPAIARCLATRTPARCPRTGRDAVACLPRDHSACPDLTR